MQGSECPKYKRFYKKTRRLVHKSFTTILNTFKLKKENDMHEMK